jgi:capsular exopolysaccharide synthesis family protein
MQSRQIGQAGGEFVDLRDYTAVLRRRALPIAIIAGIGLALGLGFSLIQTPIYTATARVLVNPPPGSTYPTRAISMDTEAQVVKSAPIAEAVDQALHSPLGVGELLRHVSVHTSQDLFVMDIAYWDLRPAQAAAGANAFARAYLDFKSQQAQQAINQQRASIEAQIAEVQRQQREQSKILGTYPPGSIAYRNARDTLDQLSVRLSVLVSSLAGIPSLVNPGQIILPASAPTSPSSPRVPLDAALGLLTGLFIGVATAFVLDRVDDRIYRRADLQLYLDAPVLAYVPHVRRGNRGGAVGLIVESAPRSPAAEAYRTARTSVLSLAGRRGAKVIAVMSPAQGEGKSTSAANLAAALAHADRRVVVVSADLRKPTIHEHFGVSPSKGLSEVLTGELSLEEAVRRSSSPNVWVLASGRIPAQPAELLQSPAMGQVVAELRETFDFVVIDCPPLLGLADSLAVVPLADAILLVVQAERTQGGAIVEAWDQLERVGGRIEGVILNDIREQRGWPGHRGYGYYLASTQYLASQEEAMGTATTIRQRTRSPFEERRAVAAQEAPLTAEPRSATSAED